MSDDDFTEIGLTRVTKRAQQRAEILARASGEGTDIGTAEVIEHDTLDDVTRLGARGARTRARTSPDVAPTPTSVPPSQAPATPSLVRPRLAAAPAQPGPSAPREHYGARPATPVIATRSPQPARSHAPVDPGALDQSAQQRATRARRRALWLVVGATCTLILVTTGILLVISALGR